LSGKQNEVELNILKNDIESQLKVASSVFDKISSVYDFFLNLFTFGVINIWQRQMIKNTPVSKFILDVGTGTGELIKKIKNHHKETICIGLDVSFKMLLKAKKKLKNENDVYLINGDIYNSPFREKTFDNVFLSLTFRHLDQKKLIKELNRILKNKGYISIFDTGKIKNQYLWKAFLFIVDKLVRPFGYLFFSKNEYDYFIESLYKSLTMEQIIKFFENYGYYPVYKKKFMFGLAFIVIFEKRLENGKY